MDEGTMEIQVGSETLSSRPRRGFFVRALGGQEWKRSAGGNGIRMKRVALMEGQATLYLGIEQRRGILGGIRMQLELLARLPDVN